jgi:hypothetical protein
MSGGATLAGMNRGLLPSGVPASWQHRFEITSFTFHVELRSTSNHPDVQRKHVVMLAGKDLVASVDHEFVPLSIEPIGGMVDGGSSLCQNRIRADH